MTAHSEKVQVKWKIGGRKYVEEFSKQSERIQLPHGKSFKAASSSAPADDQQGFSD